jgi:hypothetical protein
MGLTSWNRSPDGPIRKRDVAIAKNYLSEEELRELNRVVTMYLDYAEDQTRRRHSMTMTDWISKLDSFLQFNERNILTHAGKISHELALTHAEDEFQCYQEERRKLEATTPTSDFDHVVEKARQLEEKQDFKQSDRAKEKRKRDE